LLVVRQKRGPYAGKLDFPGGGIEFGESAELALRREFSEEVAMEFDSLQLIDNLTATVDVLSTSSNEPWEEIRYFFLQIVLPIFSRRKNGILCYLMKTKLT
jgi:8-oxo-dGTP pyrophosphatase MutT (NUDIX family)